MKLVLVLRDERGMWFFDNKLLSMIFGPKSRNKWEAAGENCIMRNFMIFIPHVLLVGYVALAGDKRNTVHCFGGKT
jgi:hypothetical protein